MLEQFKLVIAGGLLVLIGILGVYDWHLSKVNSKLIAEAATAAEAGKEAQTAAVDCSNGVDKLQAEDKAKTDAAQAAVVQAKKDAQDNYTTAAVVTQRKPEVPVITADSAKNYGGIDAVTRAQDYYATQDLFNEAIDRATGGAK